MSVPGVAVDAVPFNAVVASSAPGAPLPTYCTAAASASASSSSASSIVSVALTGTTEMLLVTMPDVGVAVGGLGPRAGRAGRVRGSADAVDPARSDGWRCLGCNCNDGSRPTTPTPGTPTLLVVCVFPSALECGVPPEKAPVAWMTLSARVCRRCCTVSARWRIAAFRRSNSVSFTDTVILVGAVVVVALRPAPILLACDATPWRSWSSNDAMASSMDCSPLFTLPMAANSTSLDRFNSCALNDGVGGGGGPSSVADSTCSEPVDVPGFSLSAGAFKAGLGAPDDVELDFRFFLRRKVRMLQTVVWGTPVEMFRQMKGAEFLIHSKTAQVVRAHIPTRKNS